MKRAIEELFAAHTLALQAHSTKVISDDEYFGCVISLASEFISDHLEVEYALILLNQCPADYFDRLVTYMQRDNALASAAVQLLYRMVQLGVTLDVEKTNVPPAEA